MMLPYHLHLFVFLIKLIIFFNAQQRTYCDVAITDICAVKKKSHNGDISRVVSPVEAGWEGINLKNGGSVVNLAAFERNTKNTTWSIKFLVKIGPSRGREEPLFNSRLGLMTLDRLANDSLRFSCFYAGEPTERKTIVLDYPKGGIIFKQTSDDSSLVELVGIKLKVSHKKKRKNTSEDDYWKMFGFEYSKHPNEEGYMKVYMNGKLAVDLSVTKDQSMAVRGPASISRGEFSCIQENAEKMGNAYYEDYNLNECKEKYKGEPKEKFVACQEELDKQDRRDED